MKKIKIAGLAPVLVAAAFSAQVAAQSVSITTTNQGRPAGSVATLPVQPFYTDPNYQILTANDLGMHCGDLDSRIAMILPPFNTVHAQVLKRSQKPTILDKSAVSVMYSSTYQSKDPALANAPVTAKDGSIFKSNFWETAVKAYSPFYPAGVLQTYLPQLLTGDPLSRDIGLPVPNVERLYLGDGAVELAQHTMPDITKLTVTSNGAPLSATVAPYKANAPQQCKTQYTSFPFFKNFAFGYVANSVKWFAAEGIPMASFDDNGRENAYALGRFQAKLNSSGATVASLDTVVPVSSEINCKNCHLPTSPGNGLATKRLANPTLPSQDPKYGHVIQWASEEWASNINTLQLHDLMHKTTLYKGFDPVTGDGKSPVACQSCHYTPALDLLQLGPQDAHGLTQTTHKSMSRTMHASHAALKDAKGVALFPIMPPPTNPNRVANQETTPINAYEQNILNKSCYQCHPGKRTQCNRGAMTQAGVVCQDCHGQMAQVGNDFSKNLPGGKFIIASDFYTNAKTPRVPWANEPTCGSCHTGDAVNNLTKTTGAIVADDGFRLLQAYLSTDPKATPILPKNMRFAEPRVKTKGGAMNPQLFRLSTGHGGVFCQGCHGSTHAEWPVPNDNANDNVAANQLQGHAGKLMECQSCHTGTLSANLDGPHGMHPVGNKGYSASWVKGHGDFAESRLTACAACHGAKGEGTDLAVTQDVRSGLKCEKGATCTAGSITIPADTAVDCGLCHNNPYTSPMIKGASAN